MADRLGPCSAAAHAGRFAGSSASAGCYDAPVTKDPIDTNPQLYRVVMENDRVRVLEYRDEPGDRSIPHAHPDSVMVTDSAFKRRLIEGDRSVDVELEAGTIRWLDAQEHSGENIGTTPTHVFLIELKEAGANAGQPQRQSPLGPVLPDGDPA